MITLERVNDKITLRLVLKRGKVMKRLFITTLFGCAQVALAGDIANTTTTPTTAANNQITAIEAQSPNLNPSVLKLALDAYHCAELSGKANTQKLTIIDYSLPSAQKRMWVIDLATNKVVFNNLVAHGKGSGRDMATTFSDQAQTHASSIGLYLTGQTYDGKHGNSLKLIGLDQGFNDQALSRNIVVHGATYVSDAVAKATNRVGNSWGCPAVPTNMAQPIINTIKDGTLVFAYYPDQTWLKESKYLNCPSALMARNTVATQATA